MQLIPMKLKRVRTLIARFTVPRKLHSAMATEQKPATEDDDWDDDDFSLQLKRELGKNLSLCSLGFEKLFCRLVFTGFLAHNQSTAAEVTLPKAEEVHQLDEDSVLIDAIVESLLASTSDIIEAVPYIESEQEVFYETGCYVYRSSFAVMELQTTENPPENTMEILESLSRNVNKARDLIRRCRRGSNEDSISDSELMNILPQLEGAIKCAGEILSNIPSSTFTDHEYAEIAVRSIASEMENVQFKVSRDLQEEDAEEASDEEQVPMESDLYPVKLEFSREKSQVLNLPQLHQFLRPTSTRSQGSRYYNSTSRSSFPEMADHIEPLYETFCCPLTKQVMEDPVTIQSGLTFERKAIAIWFQKFENSPEVICPITEMKLTNRALTTNVALQTTIEEWKDRNEVAKIKACRAALSLASTASMAIEAVRNLQQICRRKKYNKMQVCNAGILPLLSKFLSHNDRDVRSAVLELLHDLAEEDDGKEMIAKTVDLSTVVKLLSSGHQVIKHEALLLLLELARLQSLCERIGSITGSILMLIRLKYSRSLDSFASEKADEILMSLGRFPENIKQMAENGFLEPLIHNLSEGPEEMQMEMANYLGDISLGHESKTYVANSASPALITMVQSGNTLIRRAAFKALAQISSYHPNAEILTEAGILQIMVEEMFSRRIHNEPMDSKSEAATILANIFEAGVELQNLKVNTYGHKMTSDYVVYNIIRMVNNTTPEELNISLIRILLCLAESPKSLAAIVSVVKQSEASYCLVELINNPHEELGVSAIKLLSKLSPYMGHTVIERLCKTRGLPENLILHQTETTRITERQAASALFLAKLPHKNLTLNLALIGNGVVPTILDSIHQIQRSGTRSSRHSSAYLEGLVGVLVRFTATLYEPQMLYLARTYNFTSVFSELLTKTSSDEVQRLSAFGLENLSAESVNLSKPPKAKKPKSLAKSFSVRKFLSFGSSKMTKTALCLVHRGICSSRDTFCLVDANAVERLLMCLDHENVKVVDAALSAISTLLDDRVDLDSSVTLLTEMNAVKQILQVLKEQRTEVLWHKCFWVLERFLTIGGDCSAEDISSDRSLPSILISAYHHGDGNTRQMAEKILAHLNRFSVISKVSIQHQLQSSGVKPTMSEADSVIKLYKRRKMASFSMEDFVGNGVLKELLPKLLEEGWDDVPTLKIMNDEDMDVINLTKRQKDALEIRTYLHDRALMYYGDRVEALGKGLPELLAMSNADIASQFGMKRGHIARFLDRTTACTEPLSKPEAFHVTKNAQTPSRGDSLLKSFGSVKSRKMATAARYSASYTYNDRSVEQSLSDFKIKDGYVFKGVIASRPAEPRACGCIAAPPVVDQVAPYSAIENITVQKLTPEYKIGMERLVKSKGPPMKASELWRDKPAVFLCIRRPG
ncbi:Putative U-box domain-containing protein 42 [Linum perenne]